MIGMLRIPSAIALLVLAGWQCGGAETNVPDRSALDAEPIAAKYPGDRGIERDDDVVFVEDFEWSHIDVLADRWETVRDPDAMSFADDTPQGSAGKQSLLITQLAENGTGADLYRRLEPGFDRLFTRMYVKFADDCEPVHHFGTCVGGNHPSSPWPKVRAGEPTDGAKSFWVGIEPFGSKWRWDYYTYWCEMRGSPPRGQTWGNSFIQDDALAVRKGEWTCVEVMVKMNDVGDTNGELALWIDGKRVSDLGQGFPKGKWIFDKFFPGADGEGLRWNQQRSSRESFQTATGGDAFEGFRFRTVEPLNVNFLWLYVYLTKGTPGHANRIWFDDVVVARRYIGPLH